MPYFITHYADFRGRCPRKEFWTFMIVSQLLMTLLCIPAIIFVWMDLLRYEPMLQFMVNLFDYADDLEYINEMVHQDLPLLMQSWFAELPAAFWAADSLTLASTAILAVLALFLIVPTYALTACRMRDAGYSPYLALFPCLGLLSLALRCSPLSAICSVLDGLNLVGFVLICVFACMPSKDAGRGEF
ncbi:MAG: DUF805 domain-containing protein [Akkermansia sp.]